MTAPPASKAPKYRSGTSTCTSIASVDITSRTAAPTSLHCPTSVWRATTMPLNGDRMTLRLISNSMLASSARRASMRPCKASKSYCDSSRVWREMVSASRRRLKRSRRRAASCRFACASFRRPWAAAKFSSKDVVCKVAKICPCATRSPSRALRAVTRPATSLANTLE